MLGLGTIGQFAIGQVSAGTPEIITEDKWNYQWSEPSVKIKKGLASADQQFLDVISGI